MPDMQSSPKDNLKARSIISGDGPLKEQALVNGTYPLLASYYEWLRKLNSVQLAKDKVVQNEQMAKEFAYLCEHNLLFFLTVTGQFAVINELFGDSLLSPKERYMLAQIQKEYQEAKVNQRLEAPAVKNMVAQVAEVKPFSDWQPPANILSNIDLYRYYSQEIERVTLDYKDKRIVILSGASVARAKHLHSASEKLRADPAVDKKVLVEFDSLFTGYQQFKIEFEQLHAAHKQAPSLESADKVLLVADHMHRRSKAMSVMLVSVSAIYVYLQPELESIRLIDEVAEDQLRQIKLEYNYSISVLSARMVSTRMGMHVEIDNSLKELMKFAEDCPQDKLTPKQIAQLETSLRKLESYKESLKTNDDILIIDGLLKQCAVEFDKIDVVIQPVMQRQAATQFTKQLIDFKAKMIPGNVMPPPSAFKEVEAEVPVAGLKEASSGQKEEIKNDDLVELNPKMHRIYKLGLNNIFNCIAELKEGDIPEGDLKIFEEINTIIKHGMEEDFAKFHLSEIMTLCEKVKELEPNYSELEGLTDELDEITESFSDDNNTSLRI